MPREVELTSAVGLAELPAAVDKLVAQASVGEPVDRAAPVDDEELAVSSLPERRDVEAVFRKSRGPRTTWPASLILSRQMRPEQ